MLEAARGLEFVPIGIDEQYRLLMEGATDYALVLLDEAGRVAAWNAGAERLLGYRAAEIVGRDFAVFFPPDQVADSRPEADLHAAAATGRSEHERWYVRKDGALLWCGSTLTALRRESGSPRRFALLLRDQSERRLHEEALQQANERFRLASAAVNGLIYDVDLASDTVFRSEGLFRLLGYHPEEVEPTVAWWYDHIHPDDRRKCLHPASDAMADPKRGLYEVEYRVRHRDGHYVYIWDRALILRDDAGRPFRLVGSSFDVTARRTAEEALRESEERHRIISELTSDFNYSLRVESNGITRLEMVTEGFTRITGYTLEDVKARGDWFFLIHADDAAEADAGVRRVLSGVVNASLLRLVTKDGASRWVRNLNKPVWDPIEKRVVRIIGAAQDVTEHLRAEEELRQSRERLQVLSRQLMAAQENERRRLAHELHDEIGQSLTALSIHLQAAQSAAGAVPQPRLREALSIVDQALAQVRHLSLDLRPSVLDDLGLEAALRWLADRHIRLTGLDVRLDSNLGPSRLPADLETTCFRVVQEALTNIVRHAEARRVWIELHGRETIELAVRDDGIGFDAAELRRRSTEGASLGLLGMRERVELLDGEFTLDSQPGLGTTIRIRFTAVGKKGAASR